MNPNICILVKFVRNRFETPLLAASCRTDVARRNHTKDITMQQQTRIGRKGMLVSCICRKPAALCLDFLTFSVCCPGRGVVTNPKCQYLTFWKGDSTILRSQTARTNPTDSTFRFGSLPPLVYINSNLKCPADFIHIMTSLYILNFSHLNTWTHYTIKACIPGVI